MPKPAKSLVASCVILAATLSSCSKAPSGETPAEKTAVSFVQAVAIGDGKRACPLIAPEFLTAIHKDLKESGWSKGTDGTCEGYIKLASELVAGAGGLTITDVRTTRSSSRTAEVVVRSKNQPDNAYLVKKVDGTWLIYDAIDTDDF